MELQQLIEKYKAEQKNHQEWVDSYQIKLDELSKMSQPSSDDFYQNITNDKFYTVEFVSKKYEFILGGDGRSSAWSEMRNGIVLTVKIRDEYYLPNEHIVALTNYIKEKFKGRYDHLETQSIRIT